FPRRAHDDGVGRNERAVGNETVPGDDRIFADHDAFHDGGADADQAVVADAATVQDDAVRDRAIVADDGGMPIADVHHHVILEIGETADAHELAFGANDSAGPKAGALGEPHAAKHTGP